MSIILKNNDILFSRKGSNGIDYISEIPVEVLLHIISFNDPFDIISSISIVSRLFYKCCRNNSMWRSVVLNSISKQLEQLPLPNLFDHYHYHSQRWFKPSDDIYSLPPCSTSNINWINYFAENILLNQNNSMVWSCTNSPNETLDILDRYRHTSTTFVDENGQLKFMIIGGSDSIYSTVKSDIILIDPNDPLKIIKPNIKKEISNNFYVEMTEMDTGISRHTADYVQGVGVFVFGGSRVIPKKACIFLNLPSHSMKSNSIDLITYENGQIVWKPLFPSGTPPSPRSDHSSTTIGKDIYIFGGSDDLIKPLNDLFVFHTETMTWEKIECLSTPSPRSGHSMISVGSTIYVYGGGIWDTKKLWINRNSQLFQLDTLASIKEWKEIRCYRPPYMSTFSSIFAVGHHLFILFGGALNGLTTNNCYYLDTITMIWHPLKNSPSSTRNSAGICVQGHKVYFIGGTTKKSNLDILELNWVKNLKKCSYDILIKGS